MKANTPNSPLIKDWFLLGLAVGVANSLAKRGVASVLSRFGLQPLDYTSVAKQALTNGRLVGSKTTKRAFGTLSDLVVGGLFGISLARLYATTPPGNEIIKGVLGGGLIWGVSLATGTRLGVLKKVPAKNMLTSLAVDIAFGAGFGAIVGRYQARVITMAHPMPVKIVTSDEFNENRLSIQHEPAVKNN